MSEKRSWMGFADDWPDWVRKLVIPFAAAFVLAMTSHVLWIGLVSQVWSALFDGAVLALGVLWFAVPAWIAMATRVKPAGIILTIIIAIVHVGWTGYNDSLAYRLGQLKQIDAAYVGFFLLDATVELGEFLLLFYVLRQFEKHYDRLGLGKDRRRPRALEEAV
jgi:hypothetical protein